MQISNNIEKVISENLARFDNSKSFQERLIRIKQLQERSITTNHFIDMVSIPTIPSMNTPIYYKQVSNLIKK